MRSLTADQTQSGVLYATTLESIELGAAFTLFFPRFRVHRSVDGGTTWAPVHSGLSLSPAAAVARAGAVYVGAAQGVYASPNGVTWALRGLGLPRLQVYSLLVRPDGSVYTGAADGGVWRSTNRGEEWLGSDGSLNGTNPTALAYDPSNPNVLYAATWDSRYRSGVQKSTDAGATWAPTGLETLRGYSTDTEAPRYDALAVHPAAPTTVYAGGFVLIGHQPGLGINMPPAEVQVSTNGGANWTNRSPNAGPVTSLALPPGASSTAHLGAIRASYHPAFSPPTIGKVWKTVNNGDPWQETNLTQQNTGVLSLVLDPSSPNVVYAGTREAKLLKSTDGGQNWASSSQGLPDGDVAALALDPTSTATIYASVTGQGVYKSTNGGQSWAPIAASGAPTAVRRLAVDPSKPSVLYAVDGVDGGTSGRLVALDQALLPAAPTPTTVPTTCSPRPPVRVQTGQSGPGALTATVTVTTSSGTTANGLQRISFDGGSNATVEVPGQPPRAPGFEYAPESAVPATFTVRRVNPGAFSVRLTVTDACGPWQTFVGAGASLP
jgi:hypothetical protein